MDDFYIEVYESILYKWLFLQMNELKKYGIICQLNPENEFEFLFHCDDLKGIITFWKKGHIIEESIFTDKDDVIFYLHYPIKSLRTPRHYIHEFFHKLSTPQINKKIGLTCSCGIAMSVMIEKLEKLAYFMHLPFEFQVVPLYEIQEVCQDYDLILIAPQISYLEFQLKAMCEDKCHILNIDPSLYATHDYQKILTVIQRTLKDNEK